MDRSSTLKSITDRPTSTPIRFLTDPRLDFAVPASLQQSYIVASSDRYSSASVCKSLWQTGRLGAPWEYLNASFEDVRGTLAAPADHSIASTMMKRLQVLGPSEYIAELLACRTSSNGVFGLNARFDDFDSAVGQVPELLNMLAPVTYIYVDCHDKLAQAVSVVRALLAGRTVADLDATPASRPLHYDRDLISKYLGRLERQRLAWWRWFEANGIEPFVIYRDDINADIAGVIRAVAQLLDVDNDAADKVDFPSFAQAHDDATTDEWAAQFTREIESGIDVRREFFAGDELFSMLGFEPQQKETAEGRTATSFFRVEIEQPEAQQPDADTGMGSQLQLAPQAPAYRANPNVHKLPRYQQIIGQNRALLRNASVLDLMSSGGLCSFAALDAGAAYVVGVDPRPARIAVAEQAFADHGIPVNSYRFVTMQIMPALYDTSPDAFDVIIGRGVLELVDLRQFFAQLRHLRPQHVILDTAVASGSGPLLRYRRRDVGGGRAAESNDRSAVVATPSHELIVLLCDCFGFECRLDDEGSDFAPAAAGPTHPVGAQTRTYVLDRIAG